MPRELINRGKAEEMETKCRLWREFPGTKCSIVKARTWLSCTSKVALGRPDVRRAPTVRVRQSSLAASPEQALCRQDSCHSAPGPRQRRRPQVRVGRSCLLYTIGAGRAGSHVACRAVGRTHTALLVRRAANSVRARVRHVCRGVPAHASFPGAGLSGSISE